MICYGRRDRFDLEVKIQWYTTHCLEVVYLHAKYDKPVLNEKNVIARTRFAMDVLTMYQFYLEVKVQGQRLPTMVHDTSSGDGVPICKMCKACQKLQPGHDLLRTHGRAD